MLRHHGPLHQLRREDFDSTTNRFIKNKNIFAFIVEVERAADYLIPREVPVIALCDSESRTNWVSSKFLGDLERSVSTTLNPSSRPSRRKESEASRINIRWTCGKLGQHSVEGTFVIAPKAHFKILFGCGSEIKPELLPTEYNTRLPRRYTSRKGKKVHKDQALSKEVADSFRQGIENGTMIRLKRMPHKSENGLSVSLAELEVELEYSYEIHAVTDRLLSSDSIEDDDSSYILSSTRHALSSIAISSVRGSEADSYDYNYTESANTSVCDYSHGSNFLSEKLSAERGLHPPYSLQGWFGQDVCEEPQPFISRMIQPRRPPFYFTRCTKLTPKQQQAVAAVKATAEKTAREYWQWDEEAKNYKHYDEGCSEPVWYNPP